MTGILVWMALACTGSNTETVFLSDGQNYSFEGSLEIPSVATPEGEDLEICWDELVDDIQCHDVDPVGDIDNLGLIRFPALDHDGVEDGLSNGNLQQADVNGYLEYRTGSETCNQLFDFTLFGTVVDMAAEYLDSGGSYLLLLTTGIDAGVGARTMVFLDPEPVTAENVDTLTSSITVPNGCGMLEMAVELDALSPLDIPEEGPWTLDWSEITSDGQGNPFDSGDVDRVMIGRYADLDSSDLETQFLDLELIADDLWDVEISEGSSVDLSALSGDGGSFSDFDGSGTWVVALMCSTCSNPAPLFLTLVESGL